MYIFVVNINFYMIVSYILNSFCGYNNIHKISYPCFSNITKMLTYFFIIKLISIIIINIKTITFKFSKCELLFSEIVLKKKEYLRQYQQF